MIEAPAILIQITELPSFLWRVRSGWEQVKSQHLHQTLWIWFYDEKLTETLLVVDDVHNFRNIKPKRCLWMGRPTCRVVSFEIRRRSFEQKAFSLQKISVILWGQKPETVCKTVFYGWFLNSLASNLSLDGTPAIVLMTRLMFAKTFELRFGPLFTDVTEEYLGVALEASKFLLKRFD